MNESFADSAVATDAAQDEEAVAEEQMPRRRPEPELASSERRLAKADSRRLRPLRAEPRPLVHADLTSRSCSDACRTIRTSLLGLADSHDFITLVVGVTPRSGASFLARNLAQAFTFDGSQTSLLIDCNLHHPVQHEALGVGAAENGLIDFLHPKEASQRVPPTVYETDVRQLHLLPAGRLHEHDNGEHFSSPRMHDLLGFLQHRYPGRRLVLDGPSVKGSPDAAILGQVVDLVILVVGYGRASPETVRRAARQFPAAKRAGVVFNEMA